MDMGPKEHTQMDQEHMETLTCTQVVTLRQLHMETHEHSETHVDTLMHADFNMDTYIYMNTGLKTGR
jgi:hypothetical protein